MSSLAPCMPTSYNDDVKHSVSRPWCCFPGTPKSCSNQHVNIHSIKFCHRSCLEGWRRVANNRFDSLRDLSSENSESDRAISLIYSWTSLSFVISVRLVFDLDEERWVFVFDVIGFALMFLIGWEILLYCGLCNPSTCLFPSNFCFNNSDWCWTCSFHFSINGRPWFTCADEFCVICTFSSPTDFLGRTIDNELILLMLLNCLVALELTLTLGRKLHYLVSLRCFSRWFSRSLPFLSSAHSNERSTSRIGSTDFCDAVLLSCFWVSFRRSTLIGLGLDLFYIFARGGTAFGCSPMISDFLLNWCIVSSVWLLSTGG